MERKKARAAIGFGFVVITVLLVIIVEQPRHARLLYRSDFSDDTFPCCLNDAGYVAIVREPTGLGAGPASSYVWHAGTLSVPYPLSASGVDRRGDIAGDD